MNLKSSGAFHRETFSSADDDGAEEEEEEEEGDDDADVFCCFVEEASATLAPAPVPLDRLKCQVFDKDKVERG